mmetsp:Transcript_7027/g.9780  ORF Transcript_7027/g.9780 Transcript_7027/m.9780 type:complete len:134 (-) Transcript_7027:17-418(-)
MLVVPSTMVLFFALAILLVLLAISVLLVGPILGFPAATIVLFLLLFVGLLLYLALLLALLRHIIGLLGYSGSDLPDARHYTLRLLLLLLLFILGTFSSRSTGLNFEVGLRERGRIDEVVILARLEEGGRLSCR